MSGMSGTQILLVTKRAVGHRGLTIYNKLMANNAIEVETLRNFSCFSIETLSR
jgi:hypothetical protein